MKSDLKDFYVGVDLGQKRDYTVVAVIEKKNRHLTLKHLKQFGLGTEYDAILEYLKIVDSELRSVRGFWIDRTGVGEVFVENAVKHGLKNVQGIVLTLQEKQEVMTCLKQTMLEKRLHLPKDRELENEMNGEISEITSTGKTKFYHRSGAHDDRLWAVALAVYGARHDIEPVHFAVAIGRRRSILERFKIYRLNDVLEKKNDDRQQEKYDQTLTRTNLSAKILRTDPRAIIGVDLPPIRSLGEVGPTGVPKRMCAICGSYYVFDPDNDSPCGHTRKNGTMIP